MNKYVISNHLKEALIAAIDQGDMSRAKDLLIGSEVIGTNQTKIERVFGFIRDAGVDGVPGTALTRRFRTIKSSEMQEIKNHLLSEKLIVEIKTETEGRTATGYKFLFPGK